MNILISSAGKRVSLVRFFQKEMKAAFGNGKVFTTDLFPELSPACQVADQAVRVRRVSEPGALEELLEICRQHEIKLMIPTIDTELEFLATHKDAFLAVGTKVVVSELEFVKKCRDKRKTEDLFKTLGIPVPKAMDINNPVFPFFAKPYDGSLSKDIYVIKGPEDITPQVSGNPKLMFMEYLSPKEYTEFTVDMYYGLDHELKCAVPRQRIEVRAGEINKGVTRKNELYQILTDRMKVLPGAVGCITAQFFLDNTRTRVYGIELNPRFGGGYPLSYLAGANYPGYVLQEWLKGESMNFYDQWENNMLMLRYDDEIIVRNHA